MRELNVPTLVPHINILTFSLNHFFKELGHIMSIPRKFG